MLHVNETRFFFPDKYILKKGMKSWLCLKSGAETSDKICVGSTRGPVREIWKTMASEQATNQRN